MTKYSKNSKLKQLAISAGALTAITGLTVSLGSGAVVALADNSAPTTASHAQVMHENTAKEELRVAMNNLLREHVTSGLHVTRAIVDDVSTRQLSAAEESQMLNADALAAAVGSIYGGEAQSAFSELFKEHIEQSNAYAVAVADGDQAAKQLAITELQEYLNDIANFFSGAIPGLQAQDVYGLLNEHEELVNKSIDAYKAGDFVQSYQMEREALKQISHAADILSSSIASSMPEKF